MNLDILMVRLSILPEKYKERLFDFLNSYKGKYSCRWEYDSIMEKLVNMEFISEVKTGKKSIQQGKGGTEYEYDLYEYDLGKYGELLYEMFKK